jgi:hypothetical protein
MITLSGSCWLMRRVRPGVTGDSRTLVAEVASKIESAASAVSVAIDGK